MAPQDGKAVWNMLLTACDGFILRYLKSIFKKICDMHGTTLQELKAAADVEVLKAFHSQVTADGFPSQVDTSAVMKMIGSDEARTLYESFRKYEAFEKSVEQFVEDCMRSVVNSGGLSQLASLSEAKAVAETATKLFADSTEVVKNIGAVVAEITAAQAGLRDLAQGESRAQLARRCQRGFAKSKYLVLAANLTQWLDGPIH